MPNITQRERTAVIQSLSAGVVPAIGLQHIQVGRKNEVGAIIDDFKRVESGCSAVRFIGGRFGSGKTFFLNLMRTVALERHFVTINADITTDRRLHGTGGQARSLFTELLHNLATRSRPEGGALRNLIEKWVGEQDHEVRSKGGGDDAVKKTLAQELKPLQDFVGGYDFMTVVTRYYEGYLAGNDELQEHAVRWLRGEYSTKTEAREHLGVRTIVDDESLYDHLKLMAEFVRIAGYAGLLVNIDEMVVLSHRLKSSQARNSNYETVLRIVNDCLQGRTQGLCFLFAGTDECIEDRRRGMYSYEALGTRLAPNRFATDGRKDLSSPVIKLENLTPEDCYVLLNNIRNVFAEYDPKKYLVPDEAIIAYLEDCSHRMGAAYFQTPRDTVKDFVGLLKILEQNPSTDWRQVLSSISSQSKPAQKQDAMNGSEEGDDLAEFKL